MTGRNRRVRVWGLLLVLWMTGEAVLGRQSTAEHTAALRWMTGYRSADGVGCCSEQDCLPWPVAVLGRTPDQVTVRIGETVLQLPARSVHATQDGETYWCCKTTMEGRCPPVPTPANTRCVFYAVGM